MPQLSLVELEELAANATALLEDPLLRRVFDELRAEYAQTLVESDVGTPKALQAHISLKVVGDIENRIRSILIEKKMRTRYPRKEKDAS